MCCFYFFALVAMKNDGYYLAGQLMAMSIVHGGQTPHLLSEIPLHALINGPEKTAVCIEDIPDLDTQSVLREVCVYIQIYIEFLFVPISVSYW